jgi:hypothetical protein
MNKHVFLDTFTASMGRMIKDKKKFFANSTNSSSFNEYLQSLQITLPASIDNQDTYQLSFETEHGPIDMAFRVEKWIDYDHPTLIYHHGNNERPFDYSKKSKNTFRSIFVNARDEFDINIIVVRAPFHTLSLSKYQQSMTDLSNFMIMISSSVKLNESLILHLKKKNDAQTITCGISLGGWCTNLHRSFFNSSTLYIPLLAGTFLGDLFVHSKYRNFVSKNALQNYEKIQHLLNFNDDFQKVTQKNVFPLLARHDQFVRYDIEKTSYKNYPLSSLESGHVTGSLNSKGIRNHIKNVLKDNDISA